MAAAIVASILIVLVVLFLGIRSMLRSFFYPSPPAMPAVVQPSMEELLREFDAILRERAPATHAALRPGLPDEEIARLEKEYDAPLTVDLRALYRWHDGMSSPDSQLIPGHYFRSLEETLRERQALRVQVRSGSLLQRGAWSVFAGYREPWIGIFQDGAGDGYFYDPQRRQREGSFFFCFAEVRWYIFFPSVKNFVAGATECYASGVYRAAPDGGLQEDHERSQTIWSHYGTANAE